jgi:hypothetical protein
VSVGLPDPGMLAVCLAGHMCVAYSIFCHCCAAEGARKLNLSDVLAVLVAAHTMLVAVCHALFAQCCLSLCFSYTGGGLFS